MDFSFLSGVFASPWDILRSLFDIAIVAYIFYRLLTLIRGTRAEQLLKGIILLLLFSAISSFLKLDMINWLLEKVWILFAIVLPIVFQPELRRILEQLGRGNFFSLRDTDLDISIYRKVITEMIAAITVLAHNKIGALIILPRENDIEEYLDSGVDLDSIVSSGLLINIFIPNTPLHDGAVVIKEGRIYRAACFLPLSDNPGLDREVGTRHRAGLGITEVSDAIAVIVSEETGTISLAKRGNLIRHLDTRQLEEMLTEDLVGKEKWGSRRRRWLGEADKEETGLNGRT
ncbi:MAG: diadenylate cyclase CdaA [Syntrophomonadaceae bacterium]